MKGASGELALVLCCELCVFLFGLDEQRQVGIVATSGGPYNKPVTLSASGLPSGATASFSPAVVTPGSGTAASTLTIQTSSESAAANGTSPQWPMGAPVPGLAGILFLPRKWRKRWAMLCLLMVSSLASLAALSGCGGGLVLPPLSTTATVTVTATSGSDVHTTTIQLTVK